MSAIDDGVESNGSSIFDLLSIPVLGDITLLDILWVAIIAIAGVIIVRIVRIWLKRSFGEKVAKPDLDLMITLVSYFVYIVVILSILPYLHFDLSGLFVAGGIIAVAVAFATQNIVSNLVSGIFLLFERPIKIGDNVSIGSLTATVQKIQIMSTIVRTYDGMYVRVPNSKLFTSDITNLVIHPARRFDYTIGIRYQDDAKKAISIIKSMIEKEPYALKSPAPSVYVDKLDDSSVNIVVKIWSPSLYWWGLRTELLWKIKVELEKNDIQIPFPQQEVWFNNILKTDMKAVKGPPPIKEIPFQDEGSDTKVGKPKPGDTHDW
ncbi:mechanosensitive ion channel family protein [Methanocalculus taiwanensis]|uniref:Mechanosensitive ion channel family protein n=1 Tax=Methanocalculus taiwanensis TaxID=106207 RepID=A0ABD4TJ91_9EURY|nr:mechanosensitive ion channel family protein [Methanocalculus taiwanensis]MCQ1537420.1 mechanosensitive ion channel family protein [Methanocalculus taiwanensis]